MSGVSDAEWHSLGKRNLINFHFQSVFKAAPPEQCVCGYMAASAWLDTMDKHDSLAALLATQNASGNQKSVREI